MDLSRRVTVGGDEGVSRPRLAGEASSQPMAGPPPYATPPETAPAHEQRAAGSLASGNASARVRPPEMPMSSNAPEYGPPSRSRPQATSSPYSQTAGLQTVQSNEQIEPLEADWYAAERLRHRGKRCANCRDFQVAESGDRGWCRNRFAFPTPQLVGPNDLACLSCIGTWWAAHDQWWLAKAAMPQQMATPLADALLEEMQAEEKKHTIMRRPGAS
ncbi:MAG: hypothetical protein ACYDAR_04495 [Thermomicrobiales bacterium]